MTFRVLTSFLALTALLVCVPALARHKGSPNLEPGLLGRNDIIFFCDFESKNWQGEWRARKDPRGETVASDETLKFVPFQGKALRVKVEQGGHKGISLSFNFKKQIGEEPEEIYFRYYLRYADDWNPKRGGKMPGISGTYGRAGWGGRKVNGRNGWSARGSFRGQKGGKTPIGYYCYHADMKGIYGSVWVWKKNNLGYIPNNRWTCVEEYVKMNTPATDGGKGKNDGILRAWIDGKLAFEKTDVRMRDVDTLKIEKIWVNIYHGGKWSSPTDDHLYIDNVVIARKYIGPMRRKPVARKNPAKRFVFKSRVKPVAPPVLAAYEAPLQEAGKLEKKGDFEGAAAAVGKLVESAKSDDEREALSFIQQAIAGAAGLRARVIKTVQGGKRARVYVDIGMGKTRATTIGADASALKVQAQGATIPVPWRTISPKDFLGIAGRVLKDGKASDYLAIASYAVHIGLSEKAQSAIARALELDPSVKKEAARISARLKQS